MRREVLGDDSPAVARTLNNMGMVYNAAGEHDRAEESLRQAVARMERAYGPDHPDVASSHWSLAHVLWGQGKLAEAEVELRKAVAVADRAFPEDSLGRVSLPAAAGQPPRRARTILRRRTTCPLGSRGLPRHRGPGRAPHHRCRRMARQALHRLGEAGRGRALPGQGHR